LPAEITATAYSPGATRGKAPGHSTTLSGAQRSRASGTVKLRLVPSADGMFLMYPAPNFTTLFVGANPVPSIVTIAPTGAPVVGATLPIVGVSCDGSAGDPVDA